MCIRDSSWTGWSSIKNVDIYRTSGLQSGALAQTLDANFQNTYRIALGATYSLSEALRLQFGLAYDQTPVKNSTSRLTSLPDSDRTWFTFGTQWKPAKEQTLELGPVSYTHLDVYKRQSSSNPTARAATAPRRSSRKASTGMS